MREYTRRISTLTVTLAIACGPGDDDFAERTTSTEQALNESTDEAPGEAAVDEAQPDGVEEERTPLHDAIEAWGIDTVPFVQIDTPPELAVSVEQRRRVASPECSTGEDLGTQNRDDAVVEDEADREPPPYEAPIASDGRSGVPTGIRGGDRRDWPANPEMAELIDDYRASGCADDARVDDPACLDHPYRHALAEELGAFRTIVSEARSEREH